MSEITTHSEEFWEYQVEWTYPYLKNRGKTKFSKPCRSISECKADLNIGDSEAWAWAGEVVAIRKRWVLRTESSWIEVIDD